MNLLSRFEVYRAPLNTSGGVETDLPTGWHVGRGIGLRSRTSNNVVTSEALVCNRPCRGQRLVARLLDFAVLVYCTCLSDVAEEGFLVADPGGGDDHAFRLFRRKVTYWTVGRCLTGDFGWNAERRDWCDAGGGGGVHAAGAVFGITSFSCLLGYYADDSAAARLCCQWFATAGLGR